MKVTTGHTSQASQSRNLRVVSREMPADLDTPVSAFLKLKRLGARVLLESVESTGILGRYSFIGMKPAKRLVITGDCLTIENGNGETHISHRAGASPLDTLKTFLREYHLDSDDSQPRLLGGAVGYISYDFVRHFEKLPNLTDDSQDLPLALFYLIDTLVVFDHVSRKMKILCLTEEKDDSQAEERRDKIVAALREPQQAVEAKSFPDSTSGLTSEFSSQEFCRAVEKVKEHISAGDIYQLVLSRRLKGATEADPFLIYRALRMLNPSPYMIYLDFDEATIIGSSPEALVRLEGDTATVRPIAGTRPRGKNEAEDKELSEELLADVKERAEHVMLVDLGRNDLGRCSAIGSVKVSDFMTIEKFSHVIHMTSNVISKLRPELDQFDLFQAAFPAGTVSGAPKIRAMQIIEELEPVRRGPYAGAVGYFSLSGDTDWCIAIRTILMQGKEYYLQAGAGIVADSVPEKEFEETESKLAALKKAIQLAEEGF